MFIRSFRDLRLCLRLTAWKGTTRAGAKPIPFSAGELWKRTALLLGSIVLASWPAFAQSDSPDSSTDDQPSLMKLLSEHGEHNMEDERWNVYGQFTYIGGWKLSFPAPYTNVNGSPDSLLPHAENSFTGSATLYFGVRTWKGGEAYFAPEMLAERPLSGSKGLGGAIPDFEVVKGGSEIPKFYISRAYLKQTFGFGGGEDKQESGQLQLGTKYDRRRLTVVAGNMSILDFFDKSAFDIDPRQGFLNLGFVTYTAWDFPANSRGYTWGGLSEFYWDDWAVRFGRFAPPKDPNQLPIDFRFGKFYGDQIELEHNHKLGGQEGKLRVLAYRNHEDMGRFSDAIAAFEADPLKNATTCTGFNYGSNNATAPDLCWARKPNTKIGIGIFGQQYVAKDIGVFGRGMVADGKTEVDAYTPTDRSFSLGVLGKGSLWSRPMDISGIGIGLNWISQSHADYLGLGGIDGFVGDGRITPGTEGAVDLFYSATFKKWLWFTGDYQHIANPAFNRDRGPVNVFSVRVHGEF